MCVVLKLFRVRPGFIVFELFIHVNIKLVCDNVLTFDTVSNASEK